MLWDSLAAANGQRTQGVGPWSDSGYENGADVQDSIAAANRGGAGAQVFNEPGWGRMLDSPGYAYGLGGNGIADWQWQGNAAAKAEHSASLERVARSELGKEPGASNEDGGGVNHSYGGKTAIEIGVSVPPGAGVNPAGYGFELKNFKAK